MKAVNVRQLKNNPSEALREARNQPVIVLRGDRPEAVLLHLGDDSLLAEPGVRLALATSLYRDESLSLGQAARFAGLPIAGFLQHVSRLGIPVVRGTTQQVRDDAATARTWRSESSRPTPVH
jgi:predicted HTH domain antitoxin